MYYSTLPDHLKPKLKRREPSLMECYSHILPVQELILATALLIGFFIIG